MKKLILSLGVALTLSFAATFEEGMNALDKSDYETAFSIFENLSSVGDAEAQYYLGIMYANGQGVKQDYTKAKEWMKKACDRGYKSSCNNYEILKQQGY